jgi:hypothetical protein
MSIKRLISLLIIAALILPILPIELVFAETPDTPAKFEIYLEDNRIPVKNALGKAANFQTFQEYNVVVYGYKHGEERESKITKRMEPRYLGYDVNDNNYTNTYFPNDDRGSKTPLQWLSENKYVNVNGAAESWDNTKLDVDQVAYMKTATLGFIDEIDAKKLLLFPGLTVNAITLNKAKLLSWASFKNGFSILTEHKGDNNQIYYATLYGAPMGSSTSLECKVNTTETIYYIRAGEDSVTIPVTVTATAKLVGAYVKTRHIKDITATFEDKTTKDKDKTVIDATKSKTFYRKDLGVGEFDRALNGSATMTSKFEDQYVATASKDIKIIVEPEGDKPAASATIEAEESKQFTGSDVPVNVKMTGKISNITDISKIEKVQFTMRMLPEGPGDQKQVIEVPVALNVSTSHTFSVPASMLNGVDSKDVYFEGRVQYILKNGKTVEDKNIWGPPLSAPAVKDFTTIYKLKPPPANGNIPPVSIIDAPDEVEVGNSIFISGGRSYDPDGVVVEHIWDIPKADRTIEGNKSGGAVSFPQIGWMQVVHIAKDDDGATNMSEKWIKVTPPYPAPIILQTGTLKENRKITVDASSSYSPPTYPINHSLTTWTIAPDTGITAADIKYNGNLKGVLKDFLLKKPGKSIVGLTVTNSAGMSSTTYKTIDVVPDLPPIANFTVVKEQLRDPDNYSKAKIIIVDNSFSEDGDILNKKILNCAYDSDNDGLFTDEAWKVVDSIDNRTWELIVSDVGRYAFELKVEETFGQPTIPEFITLSDLLKGNTLPKPLTDKITEVINIAPIADITASVQKKLDVVVVTDYEGTKKSELDLKLQKLKYDELAQNYDMKYYFVNGSYIKEQNFDSKNEIPYSASGCIISGGRLWGMNSGSSFAMTITVPSTIPNARFSVDVSTSIGGATVTLNGASINNPGTFTTILPPGTYTLAASATLYTGIIGGHWETKIIGRGDEREEVDVWVNDYGIISGSFGLGNIKVDATGRSFIETLMTEKIFGTLDFRNAGTSITSDHFDFVVKRRFNPSCTAVLKRDGTVWGIGYGNAGQIQPPTHDYLGNTYYNVLQQLPGAPANIKKLEIKNGAIFALTENGDLYYSGNPNGDGATQAASYLGIYYAGAPSFTGWRLMMSGVKDILVSSFNPSQFSSGVHASFDSYAILKTNGEVYYHGDYLYESNPYSVTLGSIASSPAAGEANIESGGYVGHGYTSGVSKIEGLSGIDVMVYYNDLLVAHDQDTKKTYAVGDNTGSRLGFYTAPTITDNGRTYTYESIRTPIELTALAGKTIKSISVGGSAVLTTDGKLYNFKGQYMQDAPLAKVLMQGDGYITYSGGTGSIGLNALNLGGTILGKQDVYSTRINEIPNTSFREGAEKVFIYVSDSSSTDYRNSDYGTYFTALDINTTTQSYITANKIDSYLVVPASTVDLKVSKFKSQQLTLRQLVSGSTYKTYNIGQIDTAIADILAKYVKSSDKDTLTILVNEDEITYKTFYNDFESDPKNAERYKYDQDPNYYENSMGVATYNGIMRITPVYKFDKTGLFTVTYQAQDNPKNDSRFTNYWLWSEKVDQLKIYVHRRPIADFIVTGTPTKYISGQPYKDIIVTSTAYDLDHQSEPTKGITSTSYSWRYSGATTSTSGLPTQIKPGERIEITQTVKDKEGVWSYPVTKVVTFESLYIPPVAQFTIAKNPMTTEELLQLKDTSYGVYGTLTKWHWVVVRQDTGATIQNAQFTNSNKGTGTLAGYDSNVKTDYKVPGPGRYRIYLRVKDSNNLWSDGGSDTSYDLSKMYSQVLTVEESFKLIGFRVVLIRDLQLESYYKDPVTGGYRDKPIYADRMAVDGSNFGISSVTKGYQFEFEIDSVNFNDSGDTILIQPHFYTCDSFSRDPAERDLYWEDSSHKIWKAGQGGHSPWNTILLKASNRRATGSNTASWRGTYLIPSTAWAVPMGTPEDGAKASDLKRDIVVSFQIKGYKAGILKFDYNAKQWPLERTSTKAPYEIGDVIRYSHLKGSLDDIKFKDNR